MACAKDTEYRDVTFPHNMQTHARARGHCDLQRVPFQVQPQEQQSQKQNNPKVSHQPCYFDE